ncbi:hypothetical protein BDW22DRAFT_338883 [Trametopsis cervina]|nr:hypothetical protein BDW22DRAFT_338883 [Trametopsis cervina]
MSDALFFDLTTPDNADAEAFEVTAAARTLLKCAGLEVTQLRRNHQTAYRVVERSRDAYDKIVPLIRAIEDAQETALEAHWKDFVKYTSAIDALEENLFSIIDAAEEDADEYLGGVDAIDKCITAADKWETNRTKLREQMNKLYSDNHINALFDGEAADTIKQANDQTASQDDVAFFRDIHKQITAHKTLQSATMFQNVKQAITAIDGLLQQLDGTVGTGADDEKVAITIKFAFVALGALGVAAADESKDKQWRDHLESYLVWSEANKLAGYLVDQQSLPENKTLKDVYNDWLEILKVIPGVECPSTYLQLIKMRGHVRRPFHARAMALVILCHSLVDLFNEDGRRVARNIPPLETAFDESVKALKSAVEAFKATEGFDVQDCDKEDILEGFKEAEARIKDCYTAFGLTDKWDNGEHDRLSKAAEADKTRVTSMTTRLTKTKMENFIDVTVTVQGDSSPKSLRVRETTRLAAISYQVSKKIDGPKFENVGDKACTMDMAVKDVATDGKCSLVLTL